MIVKHAKDIAQQWVIEEASKIPGFYGAYYAGSVNWLPDDAILPATSDVDVWVAHTPPNIPQKLGKFIYRDVMLEVSYEPSTKLQSPELVLGDYHMAGCFRTPSIILDQSGQLTKLQAAVSKDYAKYYWVHKRCEDAMNRVLTCLNRVNESELFHDQVSVWLFANGVITHVLLVAGLKNPTIRRRYMAARELTAEYGYLDFYEILLSMLGYARMSPERVTYHLAALTDALDTAKVVLKTPYRFAADISDIARPVAIDGSQELIESGYHREAIFWIVATYSRCQHVLFQDAPVEIQEKHSAGYRQLVGDLGITSFAHIQQRGKQVREFLHHVWEVAEAIIAANPDIKN